MDTNYLDWIPMCPAQFRQRFKEILEHPPGTPEGAAYFKYGNLVPEPEDRMDESTPEEVRKKRVEQRRKFAKAWGKYAEAITARHLVLQGLPLREWDWRPGKGKGEIDLITQRGNRIIFIEVKARDGKHTDPWKTITPSKIRDLCRGANIYLKQQRERYGYQFDVALLTGTYDDFTFEYITDAFMCPLSSWP